MAFELGDTVDFGDGVLLQSVVDKITEFLAKFRCIIVVEGFGVKVKVLRGE
jgi:hypothetical protein